ncbi:MAG: amidase domain-containing protein [Oscillospiraceae bacterium]|nr:amidase domain-containing protein [Oscillospiraceae bacterium]
MNYQFTANGPIGQIYSAEIQLIAGSVDGITWFDSVTLPRTAYKHYGREGAMIYAQIWWNGYNDTFYNFDSILNNSDCANFVSQYMREGSGVPEKFTTDSGSYDSWYYVDFNNRSGSWAGSQSLHLYVKNNTVGYPRLPATFLADSEVSQLQKGDLVFALSNDGASKPQRTAYHVAIVSHIEGNSVFVYAHSDPKNDQLWAASLADTILCKFSDYVELG